MTIDLHHRWILTMFHKRRSITAYVIDELLYHQLHPEILNNAEINYSLVSTPIDHECKK